MQFDFKQVVTSNGDNLLHCAVRSGNVLCLNLVKQFLNDDYFVLYNHARLTSIFKFENLKNSTFCDERFKEFVEEQNIEGWIFREAFEK